MLLPCESRRPPRRSAFPRFLSHLALSVATIRRAELKKNQTALTSANDLAIRRALESAGVEFIDENGGGPGVRLRKWQQKTGSRRE
jgi:hypothetical protein